MSVGNGKNPSNPRAYGKYKASSLGDTTYGPKNAMGLTGQCLHARVLGFIHPRTGEYVKFEAPLPEYFQKLLEKYSLKNFTKKQEYANL